MVQASHTQTNGEETAEKTAAESLAAGSGASEISADTEAMRAMTVAGLFYGRKKAKTHPRMKPFIFATRNGVEIINLAETARALAEAGDLLAETVKAGKQVLVVGTQPAAQGAVEQFAKQFNFPYVVQRWLGGTLTNFNTISKRLDHFKKLKENTASGALAKYTKKEQLDFQKETESLEILFGGLAPMTKVPDVLFVIGIKPHIHAVREARKLRIPVVAILNTDSDPELVDYPIPANDISKSSIEWIMDYFARAISEAKTAPVPVIAS